MLSGCHSSSDSQPVVSGLHGGLDDGGDIEIAFKQILHTLPIRQDHARGLDPDAPAGR